MKKKKLTKKKIIVSVTLLLVVIISVVAFLMLNKPKKDDTKPQISVAEITPENIREEKLDLVDTSKLESFSVLLLGIDGGLGRTDVGRADSIMIATINPRTKKTTLTSIPRDAYVYIKSQGYYDKVNHAFVYGGLKGIADTLQETFEVPIDYVVGVNMDGFEKVISEFDGVELDIDETFEYEGNSFTEGEHRKLTKEEALAYARYRDGVDNDYGRQRRQRAILKALIKDATKTTNLFKIPKIMTSIQEDVYTNLTHKEMMTIATSYRTAINNVELHSLDGVTQIINGIYYEMLPNPSIEEVKQRIRNELEINENGIKKKVYATTTKEETVEDEEDPSETTQEETTKEDVTTQEDTSTLILPKYDTKNPFVKEKKKVEVKETQKTPQTKKNQ